MTCEWLVLCQEVETDPKRGRCLNGLTGRVRADALPFKLDLLVAACRLAGEPTAQFSARAVLLDPNDEEIAGSQGMAGTLPPLGLADLALGFPSPTLRAHGLYTIRLNVNGTVLARARFAVVQDLQ